MSNINYYSVGCHKNLTKPCHELMNTLEACKTCVWNKPETIKCSNGPFRCPVCNGSGIVPVGFYHSVSGSYLSSNAGPDTCRSCNGTGIIWG
jgi:hypothetical protein